MKKLYLILMLLVATSLNAAVTENLRIISLAPNLTEILYYLNMGSRIIGVTTADNYPPQVATVSHVGSFDSPSLEQIALLKPDFIFSCGFNTHPVYQRIKSLGKSIVDYEPVSLRDIYGLIDDMALRLGLAPDQSRAFRERMEKLQSLTKAKPRKKVALLFWDDPLLTVGGLSYLNDIMRVAGCENVFRQDNRSYFQTDPEHVLAAHPDLIFLLIMDKRKPEFLHSPAFKPYFEHKKIQVIDTIDPDLFCVPARV